MTDSITSSRWLPLLLIAALGCADTASGPPNDSGPVGASHASLRGPTELGHRPHWSIDAGFERIAAQIPSFAGAYLRNGELILRSTMSVNLDAALLTIENELPEVFQRASSYRLEGAEFTIRELFEEYDRLLPTLLTTDWVVTTDVHEVRNRIVVTVLESDRLAAAETLDAPNAQMALVNLDYVSGPGEPLTTLASQFDTLAGGIRIHDGQGQCSIGFPVSYSGGDGFVTASHCTTNWFYLDGNDIGQPTLSTVVGSEAVDPSIFFGGGCPDVDGCRYSDAALIDASVPISLGFILATMGRDSATTTVDPWNPISIGVESMGSPATGTTVDKVGAQTGWTVGEVDATCVTHQLVEFGGASILCVNSVDDSDWVDGGDSGLAAFYPGTSAEVMLGGIVYWQLSNGHGVFANLAGVKTDLGGFSATAGPS